ncbi:MAG: c-type cytochrome [Planctomycetes bacterium]|nr:c-type cytochrome [Planctomycetota bacterium]
MSESAKEPIKIYLDDQDEPFQVAEPPLRFYFSTIHLADGEHTLRVEASNGLAPPTVRKIPFQVRNGVAVTVSGLEPNQTIGGQVELIINAYAGNTEVDFEPRQAETPQPIPTWAWVLLLAVGAWTLFYVINPRLASRVAAAVSAQAPAGGGERIYVDTCARCHGEDGRGQRDADDPQTLRVAELRNTKNLAVAENPFRLLSRVITGVPSTQMPAWGPLLSNDEIVDVVNHVRTAWGHDASKIRLRFRHPPKDIEVLECHLAEAMRRKDPVQMAAWGWPEGLRPTLFRIGDDKGGTVGRDAVTERWSRYFRNLCNGEVTDFQLREVRYDFEPETVQQEGSYVIAMGRIYQESRTDDGEMVSDKGRFIRVYQKRRGLWGLALDFADIPFEIGCPVDPQTGEVLPPAAEAPDGDAPAPAPGPGPAPSTDLGYAEVQALLEGLGKSAKTAPHGNFWQKDYTTFVDFVFEHETEAGMRSVRLLVPWHSAESNLVRAMRGEDLIACVGSQQVDMPVRRMPVGVPPLSDADTDRLAAWIDAGCPEVAGQPSTLPDRPPSELLCPQGGSEGPGAGAGPGGRVVHPGCATLAPDAQGGTVPGGARPPGGNDSGFPPPGGDGGGFPPPGGSGDGGFPPPGGSGDGFPPPGGGDGGFPPPGGDGGFPPPGGDGGFPPPGGSGDGGFPPPGGSGDGGFPPPGGDGSGFPPPDGGGSPAPDSPGGFPPPR